ncbi:hypothetical protein HYALB_00004719 [Hymenoscyphus albidus]|uniref:Uncharacterized protein n=1 Tax=Hymenoscyphus albidus TaxID=595503 RepID=A0A9N9LXY4_9HELO|nr:hypothetical protein HYALB_00004719 [Hymenoscyphus albidus]
MAPVRRNRHETTSSASGPQDKGDQNQINYGTRSKRKATEMSSPGGSSSDQKTSTNSSQSLDIEEADFAGPPAKKSRKTSETPPKTPEPDSFTELNEFDIPEVKIDGPSSSPESDDQNPDQVNDAPSGRGGFGRGRGRGRGGRGRGRGGHGGSGIGSRGTPVVESPVAPKALRGRGGHRVKKSDNARIQALYHRRAALKHQYKQVASWQKSALLVIADKSLDRLKADSHYHESLPEFDEVTQGLKEAYQKRVDKLNAEFFMRKDYLDRQLVQNQEYEEMRFEDHINEIEETTDVKVMQKAIHVCRQWFLHERIENKPIFRPSDDKVVKRIPPPPREVHSIATPYNFTMAADEFQWAQRPDSPIPIEQHPKDHWLSMTDEQRTAWQHRTRKAGGDKGRRIKSSKSNALYQPQAAVTDSPDMPEIPEALALPDMLSAIATPAEVSGEDTETDNTESPGEEQPTDQYGVKVPKKPTPRNGEAPQNRIVGDASVTFDQDEIGIRKHHVRKNNRNEQQYLGMDPDPNPKKVHFDQVARGHNAARNKKEDLDEEKVQTFKVHPTYGLPLPTSENPTYEELENPPFPAPTDWSKPLAPTSPVVVIEEGPHDFNLLDEDKRVFLTSRSEWILRIGSEWDQIPAKVKMNSMLSDNHLLDPPRPSTPEQVSEVEPEKTIDEELLSAVNDAEDERLDSLKIKVSDSPASQPALQQFSPAAHIIQHFSPVATMAAPAPAPQRSQGYDPVRDTGYQTPYQPVAPKQQPASTIINQAGPITGLATLADVAETRGAMPPPREYRMARSTWAAPAPSQNRPAPHSTFVQYSGPPGPAQSPYTSPRAPPLSQTQIFHTTTAPQGPNLINRPPPPSISIMNGVQVINGMNDMNSMNGPGPQRINGMPPPPPLNTMNGPPPPRHDDMMNGHMAQAPAPGGPGFRELRPAPPQNRANMPHIRTWQHQDGSIHRGPAGSAPPPPSPPKDPSKSNWH